MKTLKKTMPFSLIEILMSIAIIMILAALLFPTLHQAKEQARYARWLSFNEQCSGDPDCVINFNFQDYNGNTLTTSADGCDTTDFRRELFDGNLQGEFSWTDGRWPKIKKALQFNGADTYIDIVGGNANNFNGENEFTLTCWVKFDNLDSINTLISKTNPNGTQYELFAADGQVGAVIFGEELTAESSNINTSDWVHLTLQYKMGNTVASLDCVDEYAVATGELPHGISHVIFHLSDGTLASVKLDEYDSAGDITDSTHPAQFIAAIEQYTGQTVTGYTIKAGTDHYDEDANEVADIPNQADQEINLEDLPEVDDSGSDGDDGGDEVVDGGDDGDGDGDEVVDGDDDGDDIASNTRTGTFYVFVNGQPAGSKSVTHNPASFQQHSNMIIGAESTWSGQDPGPKQNFLYGKVDEVIVTKRALPTSEIKAHYDMGKTK